MSETEQWQGRAKLLSANPDEAFYEKVANENGLSRSKYHSTWKEAVQENGYEKLVVTDYGLYQITEKKDLEDGDIYEAETSGPDEVTFILRFYNGGCPFSEAFEQAIKNMHEKN